MRELRIGDCRLRIEKRNAETQRRKEEKPNRDRQEAVQSCGLRTAEYRMGILTRAHLPIRNPQSAIRNRIRGAFSLAEAVFATVVVAGMLVAALSTVGATRVGQQKMSERTRGRLLAQQLMSEILQQNYADPTLGVGSFGLGADEVGDGSRSLWDDVDDYHGRTESPPQYKNGTAIAGLAGWGWSVSVAWVNPSNLNQTVGTDMLVKRITVTVTHNGATVASAVAVRTGTDE
jgi:MSHA pilin protein MshD